MRKFIQEFRNLPRIRQQALLAKYLLGFGIFFAVIALMASIKITPMEIYKDPRYKLRIKYPAYWEVKHPEGGALVAFVSPLVNDMDWFQENVNIATVDVSKRKSSSIRQFADTAVRQLAGVYEDNIEIQQSRPYSVGGYPGHLIIFSGRKTETPIKYLFAIFIKNDTAFIITYVALESDFELYVADVLAMLRSVRVS